MVAAPQHYNLSGTITQSLRELQRAIKVSVYPFNSLYAELMMSLGNC